MSAPQTRKVWSRRASHIVHPDEIMSDQQILDEDLNFADLIDALKDPAEAFMWCARRRLLRNSRPCERCNISMGFISDFKQDHGGQWKCNMCQKLKTSSAGSLFLGTKVKLGQIIFMMYLWCNGFKQEQIMTEVRVSAHSSTEWVKTFRKICKDWLQKNPMKVGGLDSESGGPKVVELAKKCLMKGTRRGPNGKIKGKPCKLLLGIERGSGQYFIEELEDKSRETIQNLVLQHIHSGSRIITEGNWANSLDLPSHGYRHDVFECKGGRKGGFIDSSDPTLHCQCSKALWRRIRLNTLSQQGIRRQLVASHLNQWVFFNRAKLRGQKPFGAFVLALQEMYDVHSKTVQTTDVFSLRDSIRDRERRARLEREAQERRRLEAEAEANANAVHTSNQEEKKPADFAQRVTVSLVPPNPAARARRQQAVTVAKIGNVSAKDMTNPGGLRRPVTVSLVPPNRAAIGATTNTPVAAKRKLEDSQRPVAMAIKSPDSHAYTNHSKMIFLQRVLQNKAENSSPKIKKGCDPVVVSVGNKSLAKKSSCSHRTIGPVTFQSSNSGVPLSNVKVSERGQTPQDFGTPVNEVKQEIKEEQSDIFVEESVLT